MHIPWTRHWMERQLCLGSNGLYVGLYVGLVYTFSNIPLYVALSLVLATYLPLTDSAREAVLISRNFTDKWPSICPSFVKLSTIHCCSLHCSCSWPFETARTRFVTVGVTVVVAASVCFTSMNLLTFSHDHLPIAISIVLDV